MSQVMSDRGVAIIPKAREMVVHATHRFYFNNLKGGVIDGNKFRIVVKAVRQVCCAT